MKKKIVIALILAAGLASEAAFAGHIAQTQAQTQAKTNTETESEEEPTIPETLTSLFEDIAQIETGTAGSTLKTAQAACKLLSFAGEYDFTADNEYGENTKLVLDAFQVRMDMDLEDKDQFSEQYQSVKELADKAIEDYDSVRKIFEDAGVNSTMVSILAGTRDLESYWKTVNSSITQAISELNMKVYAAGETEADMGI